MTGSGSMRPRRIAGRIRDELSELLIRGAVRDPAVQGAFITDVELTSDLSMARVYVRLLGTDVHDGQRARLLDGMARASGHLRQKLARTLGLRRVPALRFVWDDAVDRVARLEQIFAEIRVEHEEGEPGE